MTTTAVDVRDAGPGVVLVTMQDRLHKNMFSPELVDGLLAAFTSIRERESCKAVILTGFDTYFLSGGDHDGLLAIHEARTRFTDNHLYRLLLDCPIPVIAAMQGHAIGGGLAFGLFADFVILSRESVFTLNFMKYGITPGMGATYVVPKKLGLALAEEMLIGARTYRGADLERRGVAFPVLPRAEVLEHAHQLARDIAEKPRQALVLLKDALVGESRQLLPQFIERELAMHEVTFHDPAVKERIDQAFAATRN
jgi:polyketide biosynthesis enoyl-CoA hydratase PksI